MDHGAEVFQGSLQSEEGVGRNAQRPGWPGVGVC